MRRFFYSPYVWWFFVSLVFLQADARIGGGDSYGGGSRGSGGGYQSHGGGSGDGGALIELLYWILRICFRYPKVGIPLLLILAVVAYFYFRRNNHYEEYYSSYGTQAYRPVVVNRTRDYVGKIVEQDPNFSFPIFKDFIFSLYHTYHEYRGRNKLYALSAFFDPKYLGKNSNLKNVDGVVVGNCTIHRASLNLAADEMIIEVGFSANYTEISDSNQRTRYKLLETWKLKKSLKTLSKTPEDMSVNSCPNCGAPITETISGVCRSCNQSNQNGRFNWYVFSIVSAKEPLSEKTTSISHSLTSTNLVDYGTQLPTIRDPMVQNQIASQLSGDKDYDHLKTRAEKIFFELQKAWSEKKWDLARPFETDTLFQSHLFWIEDFKRNGQTNHIENPMITGLEPVSLFQDKFYMSFTFRVFASMVDYTVDQHGQIIRGNKKLPVSFSEYWTFVKGIKTNQKKAKTMDFHLCPSCGAQLKIEMSGQCEFCGTKVTLGQFDWVLSQIEQDEEFSL
ncbi:MAG: TIM44-like domain-containing protein [Bdellovibrionaceae bacterium]|nr:TIM44-like domain-containing protein [Pseudobdellovibrionaceae bacterium]